MNATFFDGSWTGRVALDRIGRSRPLAAWIGAVLRRRLPPGSPGDGGGPPEAEPDHGNPWDDPALWMLMMH